jgi:ABC-2 type transport system ATP-binding protein
VDDLSFRVERGQVCGLLGPNGAGKTTTLRMLMGLIHPDEGEIRIFGEPVRPGAPGLTRLGSVVEGPGFLPHLSGRDNLELYWKAAGRGESHIEAALKIAGLGDAVRRPVRTYSQGMRQRLALARATLRTPDLLLFDEPYAGLDAEAKTLVDDLIVDAAAQGRTVVLATHDQSRGTAATRTVYMEGGRMLGATP